MRVVALYVTVPATAAPEIVCFRVMFVFRIVAAFIASLNVMLIAVPGGTPTAPAVGETALTCGAVASAVVNDQLDAASAFPARSFAPAVIVAVMLAGFGRELDGVNSARRVAGLYATVPVMAAPFVTRRVNVVVLIVFGSIGSLNVTVTVAPGDTPTKFAGGCRLTMVGGVLSTVVIVAAAVSTDLSETIPDLQFAAIE